MDHYFLLLEEETKNRHSQQLKVLQSQASACNVGIINTKQKSCPRCGLAANSHESLGMPPAGARVGSRRSRSRGWSRAVGARGEGEAALQGHCSCRQPSPASPRLTLPCGGAAPSSPASHTNPGAHPASPANTGIFHFPEFGDRAFTGLNA